MKKLLRHPIRELRHPKALWRRPNVRRTTLWVFALLVTGYLVGQNAARIDDIQQSRRDSIVLTCRETNERNRQSFIFLKALPPNPGQPKRTKAETEKLIHGFTDALVGPVRNCEQRARELTRDRP